MTTDKQIEIYQTADGEAQIEVRLVDESVWLTQRQMAELFGKDVRTINEHIKNIFSDNELAEEATIRKFRIVRQEGARQVRREVEHCNLDMAISVGYRVNSKKGAEFRSVCGCPAPKWPLAGRGWARNHQRYGAGGTDVAGG